MQERESFLAAAAAATEAEERAAPPGIGATRPVSSNVSELGETTRDQNEQKMEMLMNEVKKLREELEKIKNATSREASEGFDISSPMRTRDRDDEDPDELRPLHGRDIRTPEVKYSGDRKDFLSWHESFTSMLYCRHGN